jgi:hypothetical protein
MGRFAGVMQNPASGNQVEVYDGFSWPCFFLGPLWYAVKGMIGMFFVSVLLAFCTFGLAWFVLPFFANRQYRDRLAGNGYRFAQLRAPHVASAVYDPDLDTPAQRR